jgi:CelD/BcsL family acetyltransferase involved in cellulose biosynthesis
VAAQAPSAADLSIRWLPSSDRAGAARIWEALEADAGNGGLTSSWAWTETWLEHYGELVPHRFAVGEAGGSARGIVLVTRGVGRRRGPFRIRSVHLGTAGEPPGQSVVVEYNRVLVEDERRAAFAAALTAELRGESDWHELVLEGFAPEDAEPFLAAEPLLEAQPEPSPIMDLRTAEAAGGDVMGGFRSKTRTKIRRSLKALGEVETEWAETPEHGLEILDELIELHQRRREGLGQPGAFASARFTAFHRDLVARLLPRGAVFLFRVRAAGGTVGCLYGFVERRRVLYYQSGLGSYSDRQIRPVFVACALCMQESFERGMTEFDFMAGEGSHKRELSTGTRELVWASARRPGARWRIIDALAAARRRVGQR